MLMLSFLMDLTNMVQREMFSFYISGSSVITRFSEMGGVKRKSKFSSFV